MRNTSSKKNTTSLSALYGLAERSGTAVYCFSLPKAKSLSILDDCGRCYIGIDAMQLESERDERETLAHELGHCETGSFYNRYSAYALREKMERRADAWAFEQLVPRARLARELRAGYRSVWELSELFSVSEDFMRRAIEYYKTQSK